MKRRAGPFVAPQVVVSAVTVTDEHVAVELKGSLAPYDPPFAPAGLYDVETERKEAVQLHKLVHLDSAGLVARFNTFLPQYVPPSLVNGRFVYRPWWTPAQIEIVMDTSLVWTRERYPNDGGHTHCMLTWEAISGYREPNEGYRSGGMWVTVEAYEKFIRDDIFRCRQ